MPFSFLPKLITDELTDITPEMLRQRGIRLLMLDFDNTIVPYTTTVPTDKMESWLTRMNALEDIQLCIVSNSHNDRVPKFCRERSMDVITHAKKPFPKGIRECLEKYNVHLVIHYDPVVTGDEELEHMRSQVTGILRQQDARLSIHDFRMVRGAGHTNLIFDIALPHDLEDRKKQIKQTLDSALNAANETMIYTVVTFDPEAFNEG